MATNSTIPFHKHCQQTVCSAAGFGRNGATWELITSLGASLNALPSNWLDYFSGNTENITQDLAGILKLMNNVAATLNQAITGTAASIDRDRQVELKMAGTTVVKFNPLMASETDNMNFPMHDLKLEYYTNLLGSVSLAMPEDQTLNIPPISTNFNKILMSTWQNQTAGSADCVMGIYPETRVIKTVVNSDAYNYPTIVPKIDIAQWYIDLVATQDQQQATSGKPVIEWEWQVECHRDDGVTIDFANMGFASSDDLPDGYSLIKVGNAIQNVNPIHRSGDSSNSIYSYTDVVECNFTKIYKFRLDIGSGDKAVLQYECSNMYQMDYNGQTWYGRSGLDNDQNTLSGTEPMEVDETKQNNDTQVSKQEEIRINGGTKVYRREWKEGGYKPRIFLSQQAYMETDVIEFEVHLKNTNQEGKPVWFGTPVITTFKHTADNPSGADEFPDNGTWRKIPLTYRTVVSPGFINVYLFRIDMYEKLITWEFKYAIDMTDSSLRKDVYWNSQFRAKNDDSVRMTSPVDRFEDDPLFTCMCTYNKYGDIEETIDNEIVILDQRYKAYFKNITSAQAGAPGINGGVWTPRIYLDQVTRQYHPWGRWGFFEFELHVRNLSGAALSLGPTYGSGYPAWNGFMHIDCNPSDSPTLFYNKNGNPAQWKNWKASGSDDEFQDSNSNMIGQYGNLIPRKCTSVWKCRVYLHTNLWTRQLSHIYFNVNDWDNSEHHAAYNQYANPEFLDAVNETVTLTQGRMF